MRARDAAALFAVAVATLLSARAASAQNSSTAFTLPQLPACADAQAAIDTPCVLPPPFDAAEAARRIGPRDHAWWVSGDTLNMVARLAPGSPAMLCCAVQTRLSPIAGTDLSSVTVRIPHISQAILEISLFPPPRFFVPPEILRGPDAPPAPPRADPKAGSVTVYDLPSKFLGESRKLTIYVPHGLTPGQRLPVIYLADDMAENFAPITEAAIRAGKIRPVILVGIAAAVTPPGCRNMTCDRRGMEYIAGTGNGAASDTPFTRHMRFVIEEVLPYVENTFPVLTDKNDRAVGGSSNGADWAIAAAALHPELFGNVIALSVGTTPSIAKAGQLGSTKLFGGAGVLEPPFLHNTQAVIDAAKAAGAQTQASILISGHSPLAWDVLFVQAQEWLFPVNKKTSRTGE